MVVTKLDRLARSTLHLCQIAAELERKQVDLRILDQSIDTSSATGRLLFNMLGAIADLKQRFGPNDNAKVFARLKNAELSSVKRSV